MTNVHDVRPRPSVQSSSRIWRPPSPTSAANNAAPPPTPVANRQPVLFVRLSYCGRPIFAISARFTPCFFFIRRIYIPTAFWFSSRVRCPCRHDSSPSVFVRGADVTRLCQCAMFFVCDRTLCDNVRPVRHSVMPLLLII
ncbi:unnamed protein product [Aphis gossypii]|uniref:Uncharacterized protein n=1 Tax=Aphis gossypii TaxID=80765 RepID=A0A9P0NJI4_APHGO|nr:unnamed protein product [Aphis gossypii]